MAKTWIVIFQFFCVISDGHTHKIIKCLNIINEHTHTHNENHYWQLHYTTLHLHYWLYGTHIGITHAHTHSIQHTDTKTQKAALKENALERTQT